MVEDLERKIRKIMTEKNASLFESIIIYCEQNYIEPEVIATTLIKSQVMTSQLYEEAEKLNMVVKSKQFPK